MTWGLGSYEDIAVQLLPAAATAIEHLNPLPGEFVVDVGCGTGNATFLAAARGARVLGVDPTPRLLAIAREAAATTRLDLRFESGDAASIPAPDRSVDAVLSVFAVIFAPDAIAAATEMVRVLAPAGRIVLTAWLPGGALGALYGLRQTMIDAARGVPAAGPAPFAWHDVRALRELFAPHGLDVELEEAELALYGRDLDDYVDAELRTGPLWSEARSILEPQGRWTALRDAAYQAYADANEDPSGFKVTTRFVVAVVSAGATGGAVRS